ncbi:MAG: ABC transporter permease [Christensenellales bacterium]
MNLWQYIGDALRNMGRNIMRSALTMLGIVIGTGAIITVIAVGNGGRQVAMEELQKLGIDCFKVYGTASTVQDDIGIRLVPEDARFIDERVPKALVSVRVSRPDFIEYEGTTAEAEIVGTDTLLYKMEYMDMLCGRFLKEYDVEYERRVVVVGMELAKELFGTTQVMGNTLKIKDREFTIIGVEETGGVVSAAAKDEKVYIPYTTFRNLWGTKTIDEISIMADSGDVEELGEQAVEVLTQKYGRATGLFTLNMAKESELADNVLNIFGLVVSAIAAVSLLVGGIGIMNVMLVSVKERTQEIGVRKALGARNAHIVGQFLTESLCYSVAGGILGILAGIGFAQIAQEIIDVPTKFTLSLFLLSVSFAAAIGLFFGIYPALKAARMEPVEALRQE